MSGARDRHDVVTLCQHPRQRELRRRALVLLCDFLDSRDQPEIVSEVLSLKARVLSPEIVLRQIIDLLDLSSKKSATERAVCDEANVQKAQCIEQSILRIARPK